MWTKTGLKSFLRQWKSGLRFFFLPSFFIKTLMWESWQLLGWYGSISVFQPFSKPYQTSAQKLLLDKGGAHKLLPDKSRAHKLFKKSRDNELFPDKTELTNYSSKSRDHELFPDKTRAHKLSKKAEIANCSLTNAELTNYSQTKAELTNCFQTKSELTYCFQTLA